jgi:hypothetical protein
MTSLLPKRIIAIVSFVLALGILTPSAVKLSHSLFGHSKEKRCIAEGTKHIHEADIHCEFHDFTLASKVFVASSYEYVALEVPIIGHQHSFYNSFLKSQHREHLTLRAPPAGSL